MWQMLVGQIALSSVFCVGTRRRRRPPDASKTLHVVATLGGERQAVLGIELCFAQMRGVL